MRHIPNLLSFFRIVLIPFFIQKLFAGDTYHAALILACSGISDFLDGLLARSFGWVSQLGKMLDPMSDKLTVIAVSISLMLNHQTYWYFFALLLLKEMIMLLLSAYVIHRGVKMKGSGSIGKIATAIFYVSMILILLFPALPDTIVRALLIVTTASSIAAAFFYLPGYRQYLDQLKTPEK